MAYPTHLTRLKEGADAWNEWRKQYQYVYPALVGADLAGANLAGFNLGMADLTGANLEGANVKKANLIRATLIDARISGADLQEAELIGANLNGAILTGAILDRARLTQAQLVRADLSEARLHDADLIEANLVEAHLNAALLFYANFRFADLRAANLTGASLQGAHFEESKLNGCDMTGATFSSTAFLNTDLSGVRGLDSVQHLSPSSIGLDTLYRSGANIPDKFLRGTGVPEEVIENWLPSIRAGPAIQWHSCFISFSTKDGEFARRLYGRMKEAGLRVWFAPEDLKGGDKLYDQIDRAIQLHDKLLVVLSEESVQSEWVITEIRKALQVEKKESRRKLFPIRLVDFDALRNWTCFDADSGKDLAVEVREYAMPNDFSNWKDHDAFETAFDRLLKDLRAEESKKA